MRVIAGEKRHLILKTLSDLSIRPTTDKIKETLFNMIQFNIEGKSFLDLFAGSGAIGIEALSRRAKNAVFVDNNSAAIKVIKENLEHTKLMSSAKVLKLDASAAIDMLDKNDEKFDIVFMDPPYNEKLYIGVLEKIKKSNVAGSDTIIIVEANIKDDVKIIENIGYEVTRIKEYKTNKHIFLKLGAK